MKEIVLVDFSWLYNKYYYVATTQVSKENVSNHLLKMLMQFLHRVDVNYSEVFLVLDPPLKNTINFSLNKDYKQQRDKEAKKEVYESIQKIVKDLNNTLSKHVHVAKSNTYEADQVIAYLAEKYMSNNKVIIFSGDKDLLQMTQYPNVRISDKFKDGRFMLLTDTEIFSKFKNSKKEDFTRVSTNKADIVKYRSLKGDKSDNLKPVFPKIRDKEIINIVREAWTCEYFDIDTIINNVTSQPLKDKLEQNRETWITNYRMMNLINLQIPDIKILKKLDKYNNIVT